MNFTNGLIIFCMLRLGLVGSSDLVVIFWCCALYVLYSIVRHVICDIYEAMIEFKEYLSQLIDDFKFRRANKHRSVNW
jgi:hypothetical protein